MIWFCEGIRRGDGEGLIGKSPIIGLITWSPNVCGSWWGVAGWPDVVTMTVSKYFLIITTIKYFCLTNNGRNVIHRINDTVPPVHLIMDAPAIGWVKIFCNIKFSNFLIDWIISLRIVFEIALKDQKLGTEGIFVLWTREFMN